MRGTSGVMARDMSVLLASCKALMSAEQFEIDSGIPPMTFNQQVWYSMLSSNRLYGVSYHLWLLTIEMSFILKSKEEPYWNLFSGFLNS